MSGDNNGGGGGRSLGGGDAEPLPSGWGASSGPRIGRIGGPSTSGAAPSRSGGARIAGLRDLSSAGPSRPAAAHDHSDDDSEDGAGGENWFAGGERSGINVQNPDRRPPPAGSAGAVQDILRKASQAPRAPAEEETPQSRSAFFGSGNTLGSDEIESTVIPDPRAPPAGLGDPQQETAIRHITFWKDGFSIEDGELMTYDNPEHQRILDAINSGNAPPSYLNVQVNQPVELRVARRVDENYVAPPKVLKAFAGSGNRLGSPAPSTSAASTSGPPASTSIPGAFPSSSVASSSSTFDDSRVVGITPRFEVNMDLPNTSVQIRLADGTRLVSRMNMTHTVGDIRNFINASRPPSEQRPYTIGTTFPNKTLDDDSVTIEAGGLKNSVIVQRWI